MLTPRIKSQMGTLWREKEQQEKTKAKPSIAAVSVGNGSKPPAKSGLLNSSLQVGRRGSPALIGEASACACKLQQVCRPLTMTASFCQQPTTLQPENLE
jgi:hypothetical protein